MDRSTLTEIHALCYQEKPEDELPQSPSVFYAVIGDILIKTPQQHPSFPPASSWVVEGRYIKWGAGSQGASKSVSIEIVWKLKGGSDGPPPYSKYNIYVEKLAKSEQPDNSTKRQFLGTAHVAAYYVSELAVPGGVSTIRFVIQACSDYGVWQKLDKSPSFLLNVQG